MVVVVVLVVLVLLVVVMLWQVEASARQPEQHARAVMGLGLERFRFNTL